MAEWSALPDDPDVREQVALLMVARAQKEASRAPERGDHAGTSGGWALPAVTSRASRPRPRSRTSFKLSIRWTRPSGQTTPSTFASSPSSAPTCPGQPSVAAARYAARASHAFRAAGRELRGSPGSMERAEGRGKTEDGRRKTEDEGHDPILRLGLFSGLFPRAFILWLFPSFLCPFPSAFVHAPIRLVRNSWVCWDNRLSACRGLATGAGRDLGGVVTGLERRQDDPARSP